MPASPAARAPAARPRPVCGQSTAVRTRSRPGAIRPPPRSPAGARRPNPPARQHVTGEVVPVQSVYDHHDRPRELVVQRAVKRVVVPLLGRLAPLTWGRLTILPRAIFRERQTARVRDAGASLASQPRSVGCDRPRRGNHHHHRRPAEARGGVVASPTHGWDPSTLPPPFLPRSLRLASASGCDACNPCVPKGPQGCPFLL